MKNEEFSEDFKLKFKFLVMSLSVFPFSQILVIVLGHVYSSAVIIVFSLIKGVFLLLKSGKKKLGASLLRKFLFRRARRENGGIRREEGGGGKREGAMKKKRNTILGLLKLVGGEKNKGEGVQGGGGEGEGGGGGIGIREGLELIGGWVGVGENGGGLDLRKKERDEEEGTEEEEGWKEEEEGREQEPKGKKDEMEEEERMEGEGEEEEEGEEQECYICLEVFLDGEEVVEFRCGRDHVFHEECIGKWIKRKRSCPICRRVVEEEGDLGKDLDILVGRMYNINENEREF